MYIKWTKAEAKFYLSPVDIIENLALLDFTRLLGIDLHELKGISS